MLNREDREIARGQLLLDAEEFQRRGVEIADMARHAGRLATLAVALVLYGGVRLFVWASLAALVFVYLTIGRRRAACLARRQAQKKRCRAPATQPLGGSVIDRNELLQTAARPDLTPHDRRAIAAAGLLSVLLAACGVSWNACGSWSGLQLLTAFVLSCFWLGALRRLSQSPWNPHRARIAAERFQENLRRLQI